MKAAADTGDRVSIVFSGHSNETSALPEYRLQTRKEKKKREREQLVHAQTDIASI